MTVDILRDCVVHKDGSLFCWDRNAKKYYVFKKTEVPPDEVAKEDLLALIERISRPDTTSKKR